MMPGNTRAINNLQTELDVREHDIGGATRDDIDRLTILFPVLDPATGEFAPEAVCLDNEAAAVLLGKCGKTDLLRPSFPDEHLAALIRVRGPCPDKSTACASSRRSKLVAAEAAIGNLNSRPMPSLHACFQPGPDRRAAAIRRAIQA